MAKNSYYLLDECFPEVLMEHHLHAKDSSLVNTLVKFLFKWLISSSAIFKLNNNCDCGYQICMIWLQLPREIHIMLSIYHADFIKNRMLYFRVFLIIMKPFNSAYVGMFISIILILFILIMKFCYSNDILDPNNSANRRFLFVLNAVYQQILPCYALVSLWVF